MGRFIGRFLWASIAFVFILGVLTCLYVGQIAEELQSSTSMLSKLSTNTMPLASEVFDKNGTKIGEFLNERRYFVSIEQIPTVVKNAFLSAEDKNFYSHSGISFSGILRAAYKNMMAGRIHQGASTISQQVVRQMFLTRERTYKRKIKEVLLTFELERHLSKDQILELYLNKIFLGNRSYGVEAASRNYFRKSVKDLTISEATLLAGLPKAPAKLAPHKHLQAARLRQQNVLIQMLRNDFLNKDEITEAYLDQPKIYSGAPFESSLAPHFVAYIRKEIENRFGNKMLHEGGLKIVTTLDMDIQQNFKEVLTRSFKKGFSAEVETAVVSLDPTSGAIRALLGGREFERSQYDRAISAQREIGSLILPLYFSLALERGYTLVSSVSDIPMSSSKASKKEKAGMTLYEVLIEAGHFEAMRLFATLGNGTVKGYLEKLGLYFKRSDITLGMGRGLSSPIGLAQAFAPFANKGKVPVVFGVSEVRSSNGDILYSYIPEEQDEVMEPSAAFIIDHALKDVVKYGVGSRAQSKSTIYAGMPGVSSGLHDAWFVGYVPRLVTSLWVGSEHGRRTVVNSNKHGYRAASHLWGSLMKTVPTNYLEGSTNPGRNQISYSRMKFDYLEAPRRTIPFKAGTQPM